MAAGGLRWSEVKRRLDFEEELIDEEEDQNYEDDQDEPPDDLHDLLFPEGEKANIHSGESDASSEADNEPEEGLPTHQSIMSSVKHLKKKAKYAVFEIRFSLDTANYNISAQTSAQDLETKVMNNCIFMH